MNKKENRMVVRQEVQKSVIRDEQNRRIQFAATNPINEVLKNLHTPCGVLTKMPSPSAAPNSAATR